MKFAVQTIIFGPSFESVEHFLAAINIVKAAGFSGVEISQPPSRLPVSSINELQALLQDHGLLLTGLCGGSLETRIRFCGDDKALWPLYLYTDSFDDSFSRPESHPPIAIHPHKHRPSEDLSRVAEYLSSRPESLYLPDTAHLAVIGADIEQEIFKWQSRLAAVHLKGWRSDVGRSAHQYARAFSPLVDADDGVVNSILQRLSKDHYDGWLVVEVDSVFQDCRDVLMKSAKFLIPHGHPGPQSTAGSKDWPPPEPETVDRFPESRLDFLRSVSRTQDDDLVNACGQLSDAVVNMFGLSSCQFLVVNNLDQTVDGLHNQSVSQNLIALGEEAVTEQIIRIKDKEQEWWAAVPVANRFNSNHIRYVLLLGKDLKEQSEWKTPDEADLYWSATRVGWQCELALERVLARAEAQIAALASTTDSVKSFLAKLEVLIGQLIRCDRITSLLPNSAGLVQADVAHLEAESGSKHLRLTLSPRFGPSETVILCERISNNPGIIRAFTEDDIAVLDSISSTIVRTIHSHQTKRMRDDAHERILHMLSDPVRRMQSEMNALESNHSIGKLTDFDLPGDVFSWVDTVTDQIEIARNFTVLSMPTPRFQPTFWLRHIIAPAIRHIQPFAEELGLPLRDRKDQPTIWYTPQSQRLADAYVDRTLMQRVVFNMLDNAIKHFMGDINDFRVQIHGEIDLKEDKIRLYFRDWGPGIPDTLRETIFEEGVRSLASRERQIPGDGFGLGMVRRVLQLHGGKIWLKRAHTPTEFVAEMPKALRYGPPG